MPLLEAVIEGTVRKWALANGCLVEKVRFHVRGYPDRLFILPNGCTIYIEFKRPGAYPYPLQRYRLDELNKRGQYAFWTNDADLCIAYLKRAMESQAVSRTCYSDAVTTGEWRLIPGSWLG